MSESKLHGEERSIGIVGGGFSGTMVAVHLLEMAGRKNIPLRLVIFEKEPDALGRGTAYSTRQNLHLLNVPASRMSSCPDRPADFTDWIATNHPELVGQVFVSRKLYGDYLQSVLAKAIDCKGAGSSLVVIREEAVAASPRDGQGWTIATSANRHLDVNSIVLAVGHRPPGDPLKSVWKGSRFRWVNNPWQAMAAPERLPDGDVVLLGSGLTAVDHLLSLTTSDPGRRVLMISRNGLLPAVHLVEAPPAADLSAAVAVWLCTSASTRLGAIRNGLRLLLQQSAQSGEDWRSVVDGMRPFVSRLWQSLSVADQRKFLHRLRPFWEVHRHRMAPAIGQRLEELRNAGRFELLAGKVIQVEEGPDAVSLAVQLRQDKSIRQLRVGCIVNCTGPASTFSFAPDPIICSLLEQGMVSTDPHGLGLKTSTNGSALDRLGKPVESLRVIGTLRKPDLWESTAVPELREQARETARCLLEPGLQRPVWTT